MVSIWKFQFEIQNLFTIDMPRGAVLLHVEAQNGQPCLWARVHTDVATERKTFRIFGTGHDAAGSQSMIHVGTFQMAGGAPVWHLFEE